MRRAAGWTQDFFGLESFRVIVERVPQPDQEVHTDLGVGDVLTEATIKIHVDGERIIATGEGNGPINALDQALRVAIGSRFPQLGRIHLTDFKVRVLDTEKGTGAVTRVLIDSTNGDMSWTTIGVGENIIEASWQALVDSFVYGLLHTDRDW
jgi:2-isopropylmalate synthase